MATYNLPIPEEPRKREISVITVENGMFVTGQHRTSNYRMAYELAAKGGKEVVFK